MSDTIVSLRRKISSAGDLQSVVRTMKALASSSIGQYDQSVRALGAYYKTVELGLSACFRKGELALPAQKQTENFDTASVGAIVIGSDQGLVGQFNDVIADYAIKTLNEFPGKPLVWAVGERVHTRLVDAGMTVLGQFPLPSSVKGIVPLVGQLQIKSETHRTQVGYERMYVFHNKPKMGSLYEPVSQRLLPLDAHWLQGLTQIRWPTVSLPEVVGTGSVTLRALIREYLFISLFRACAESLASENASRLAAMERADKNIDELLENLQATFNRLRQTSIDEELFDVISGYEALAKA